MYKMNNVLGIYLFNSNKWSMDQQTCVTCNPARWAKHVVLSFIITSVLHVSIATVSPCVTFILTNKYLMGIVVKFIQKICLCCPDDETDFGPSWGDSFTQHQYLTISHIDMYKISHLHFHVPDISQSLVLNYNIMFITYHCMISTNVQCLSHYFLLICKVIMMMALDYSCQILFSPNTYELLGFQLL